jgi:hypothetical protein
MSSPERSGDWPTASSRSHTPAVQASPSSVEPAQVHAAEVAPVQTDEVAVAPAAEVPLAEVPLAEVVAPGGQMICRLLQRVGLVTPKAW